VVTTGFSDVADSEPSGNYDRAAEALEKTRRDYVNRHAAGLLVNVLDQLQRSEKKAKILMTKI